MEKNLKKNIHDKHSNASKRILNIYFKNVKLAEHQKSETGTSLVVQWLRLCAPNAGGLGSVPVRELDPVCATKDLVQSKQINKEANIF